MKKAVTFVLLLFSMAPFAQNINRRIVDEKAKGEILIGVCNKEVLLQAPFSDWFKREYESYIPDGKAIVQLKSFAGKWKVVIVFGTWCSDSQLQVPRFLKTIDNAGYLPESLKMICLDSEKKCDDVDVTGMKIDKVPTFIIYSGNKEIGRITETPATSMEMDLLNILQKQ